jgi:predicted 3-demethylubiquinone-9 3-methyltransferase (glyoxalase superfamily)
LQQWRAQLVLAPWLKTAEENRMKKINPFLWFDSEAEQAAKFYVGIFKNSKIGRITPYGEDGPRSATGGYSFPLS